MADVKVPALLHKMTKTAQKAWYKKHGMEMPDALEGKSAAAAKRVKVAPRKTVAIDPTSVRAVNAARQQAYMAKGGRQPIGAMGSGGSNVMAGGGQSTIKDLKASIKAGFNPKVSLDPYESEKAKKVGPRSLKLKKESVDLQEVTKSEAESMLGGPVKEKPKMPPGKRPAGYRYVRALARKAMKKGMKEEVEVVEAVKDAADVGEYDYEGDMAKSQLRSILANAKRMHDMLEENTNLPEWVQSKITLAEDYISTAANYMEGEMNEELIRQEEAIFEAMKKMEMEDEDEGEDEIEDDETEISGKKKKDEMKEEVEQTDEAVRAWVGRERDFAIRRPADQGERDKLAKDVIANRKYNKGKKMGASSGSVRKNASGLTPSQRSTRVTSGGQPINNKELGNKQFAYEEVELDEAQKKLKPSYWKAEWRLGTQTEVDKNNKKIYDRLAKTDPVKAAAFHNNLMKLKKKDMKEEVVTEGEGKVAVTPKEKSLAAHHGDKTKITYGDVIKARIKSSKEKLMKGKE
jgi:hypothetical protein